MNGLFQDGYRVGRYNQDHIFIDHPPLEYLAGVSEGRRRRRMQLVVEFTLLAAIVLPIIAIGAAAATRSGLV